MSLDVDAAVAALVHRYASAVDRRDPEAVVACFTADGVMEISDGAVVLRGHDELRAAFHRALEGPEPLLGQASTHLMANVVVGRRSGATAQVVSQGVAFMQRDPRMVVRGLWYEDECVKGAAGWRFAHRRHRAAWQFEVPAGTVLAPRAFLPGAPDDGARATADDGGG